MTTLADMVLKAQQNGSMTHREDGSSEPIVYNRNPIVDSSNLSDRAFYIKMWSIDPDAAKVFMESRLRYLREKIVLIRNEMSQLEEYLNNSINRPAREYFKRAESSGVKVHGLKAQVLSYMRDNIGRDVKPLHIFNHFQEKGLKDWSVGSINQCLAQMKNKKEIENPYRGYYRLKEEKE